MQKDIKVRFAKRLKKLRKEYGYTQQRLSEAARVDYKHIQRLESKNPSAARIDTAEKIARAFNISLSQLMNFENWPLMHTWRRLRYSLS